jgi:hypothetical protein
VNLNRKEGYTKENAMEEQKTELETSSGQLRSELSELRGKLRTLQWLQIGSWVILIAVIIITWLFPHFRFGGGQIPGGGIPNPP